MSTSRRIVLTRDDGVWIAKDDHTGVVSQGQTRESALENLDDAVAGFRGAGREPTAEELAEVGIDPERNVSEDIDESSVFE